MRADIAAAQVVAAQDCPTPGALARWSQVSPLRSRLHRLLSIAVIPTLLARLRHGAFRVICYRGATVHLPRSVLSGGGRLSIGKRWFGQRATPTSVVAMNGGKVCVDGNFVIHRGADVRVSSGATLQLGSGYLGDNVHIDCHAGVVIGHGVAIAKDTTIMDTDHHELTGQKAIALPIRIGDHVWIGTRVTILKGVTIGEGAVIAAGSVVTTDVEPGMLYAGVPARPIRPASWKI